MLTDPMNVETRPRILVLLKHYEPAFRLGGPIKSVANMVAALGGEFDFRIVCLNRDFREITPLAGIQEGSWLARNGAHVCYLDAGLAKPMKIVRRMQTTDYDLIYLNSFLDPLFSTLPAILVNLKLLKRRPIIIAPRGEFSPGALALKSLKKRLFLGFQSTIGLYVAAYWQATTELEAEDIRRVLGGRIRVITAPNLAAKATHPVPQRPAKRADTMKCVFLSRISPKKNLLTLIRAAGRLRGNVDLAIWGPIDDVAYWRQCNSAIAALPSNVAAQYRGEAHPETVQAVLEEAEVFALPTLGENYGHVIQEALSAGCPVVISDKTPWRDLAAAGVGFDVPIDNGDAFVAALQVFIDMEPAEYGQYAARCRAYATNRASDAADVDMTRQMFLRVLGATP